MYVLCFSVSVFLYSRVSLFLRFCVDAAKNTVRRNVSDTDLLSRSCQAALLRSLAGTMSDRMGKLVPDCAQEPNSPKPAMSAK